MVAVEFARDGTPDAEFSKRAQAQALQRGLILLSCGVHGNVLRFLFPLSVSQPVFDEALGVLRDALVTA